MRQTEFFLILDHFLPFYLPPPNNPENQNFVKNGNKYLVPGDIIILHKCTKYDKHMIYGFWDMKHNRQIFFVILGQFLPFYPTSNPKNQNFEKKKHLKILSFYKSGTKNHDYMLYCSWDMAHDRSIFLFSFSAIFCPSTPLTPQTMKISKKKKKKGLEITSFYTRVPKIMIICYTVPKIWHKTNVIVVFHFGLFFALLPL